MKYSIAAAAFLATSALASADYGYGNGAVNVHTTTVTKTIYVKATPASKGGNKHQGHHGQKPKKTVTATVTSTAGCGNEVIPIAPPTYAPVPEPKTYEAPAPPKYTPAPQPPKYTQAPKPEPSSPPAYTPPTGGSIADQCVREHNKYRQQHGAEPVAWSEKLVGQAAARSYNCKFQHMQGTGNGENLAQGYGSVADAIKGWYDEKDEYRQMSNPGFSMGTGHYTQVVWKGTKEIGCVFDQGCPENIRTILRCQYHPPGNYAGEYKSNVQN